jgi:serine/threonine-protein kinase RsbW/stage II sporulation protein AB (anti-sigma F factor)
MSDDVACTPELRITLPARRASLALLRHVVRGFRDAYAIAPAAMDDIVLAINEAATNAVVHAYGEQRGTMTVVARVDDDHLHVLVRDHGCGIAPPDDQPMLGHGLALMAHVAATFEVVGSPAGTDVLMTFDLAFDIDDALLGDFDTAS